MEKQIVKKKWMLLSIACFVAWGVIGTSTEVMADELEQKAKASFVLGNDLFASEQYAAAAEAYREAYRIKPSWKIQYNIAQAESAAKRYGLALQAFELFLADGGDEVGVDRKDMVLEEIRRLRDMVASLNVEGPDEAVVFVDDLVRGEIPLEGVIKVTAGKRHSVSVVLGGVEILSQKIRLSGGDSITLKVKSREPAPLVAAASDIDESTALSKTSAAKNEKEDQALLNSKESPKGTNDESVPPQASTDGGKKMRIVGGILLLVGSAVTVGGGIMGGLSLSKAGELDQLCEQPSKACTSSEATQAYDDAEGYGRGANIFISAGVATAVTGLILFIVGKKKKKQEQLAIIQLKFQKIRPQLQPVVSEQFSGMTLVGSF